MKKIIVLFSLLISFLFSFSSRNSTDNKDAQLLNQEGRCDKENSIVNITTANNVINASGFIMFETTSYFYVATSSAHYDENYKYEIVFNDYSRKQASIVGVANMDKVLVLKVEKANIEACPIKFSKSSYIEIGENVTIVGKHNYKTIVVNTFINSVGVCTNCNQETYKLYYHSIITEDMPLYFIGSGVFDYNGHLLGMINGRDETYKFGNTMLDVDKLYAICYNLINKGKYNKNYIEYNLLDVNSLTNYEKYLYSLDEGLTSGVLVSSVHYLNYLFGGLNQGMVILAVNDVPISNCYKLDIELSKYKKGSRVSLTVLTINNKYKIYRVKI